MRTFLFIFLALIFISCGDSKKKQETTDVKSVDSIKKEKQVIALRNKEETKDTSSREENKEIPIETKSVKRIKTKEYLQPIPPYTPPPPPPYPTSSTLMGPVGIVLTQYSQINIKNPYLADLELIAGRDTLVIIPPGKSAKITIHGEKSITFKVGNEQDTKPTEENRKPEIKLINQYYKKDSTNIDNIKISLKEIQSKVGYRVDILDDFPKQLEVKFSGPVTTKQIGPTTYDITLSFLSSESAFETWSKDKKEPYKVIFAVEVKDTICLFHDVKETGEFIFSKW